MMCVRGRGSGGANQPVDEKNNSAWGLCVEEREGCKRRGRHCPLLLHVDRCMSGPRPRVIIANAAGSSSQQ